MDLFTKSVCIDYCCVCFTETWLDDTVLDAELFCDNYAVYRCDRSFANSSKSKGGGVLVAVHKSYSSMLVPLRNMCVEMLCVKILIDGQCFYVFDVYIPPDVSVDKYSSCIKNITNILDDSSPSDKFVVTGDFNLPEIEWTYADDDNLNFMVPSNIISEKSFFLLKLLLLYLFVK